MNDRTPVFIASLLLVGGMASLHADTLTIEGDLNVQGTANDGELAVNEDTTVTAPAVQADFKVEDNGVIWAGSSDNFDATRQCPNGQGNYFVWLPDKGAFRLVNGGYLNMNDAWLGLGSVAYGFDSTAGGQDSMAWSGGYAVGNHSTAWANGEAYNDYSTAFGGGGALGAYSVAWGAGLVYTEYSTAWASGYVFSGDYGTAWAQGAVQEEYGTAWAGGQVYMGGAYGTAWAQGVVEGEYTTAWGYRAYAKALNSTSFGYYNLGLATQADSQTIHYELDPLLEIGNGTNHSTRANALTLLKNGQLTLANRYWDSLDPTAVPADPDATLGGDQASAGEALVVNGHARFNGNVILADGSTLTDSDSVKSIVGVASGENVVVADANGTVTWGGSPNTALGANATAWGGSYAFGDHSTVWAQGEAGGQYATAWAGALAYGQYSTAWAAGYSEADHATAWALGSAYAEYSTAWGGTSTAAGSYSTAWSGGYALGDYATAWAGAYKAEGVRSTACGYGVYAKALNSTSFGYYNLGLATQADSQTIHYELDPLLEIGNGTNHSTRANALTLLKNGQLTLANRYWDSLDPTAVPADPDATLGGDQASAGEALVVNGHARFNGNVETTGSMEVGGTLVIMTPAGDIPMISYD